MKSMVSILGNIFPLKESNNGGRVTFVISKVLAFLLIYFGTAVIVEGIIMLTFGLLGYDFLHGEMPVGEWVGMLPLFGFICFAILTLLYVKLVEKQKLSSIKLELSAKLFITFVKGIAIGIMLVIIVIGILYITGNYTYKGVGEVKKILLLWLIAYFIQGVGEEIMCRGFIQNSLNRRVNITIAILLSSGLFMLPHIPSMEGINKVSMFFALVNLLLISILFSLTMIYENSIGIACGIHVGWNFFLGNIFGLQVSGSESANGIFQFELISKQAWF